MTRIDGSDTKRARAGTPWLLHRYLFRNLAGPAALVALVVLAALSLERVLRLVRLVENHGAPLSSVVEMILYLLPHYFALAAPAGLFIGAIMGVRRLEARSELVAMRACGFPMRGFLIPQSVLAGGLGLALLGVTGFLQPFARHAYRERANAIGTREMFGGLQPGVFQRFGENSVVRAEATEADGRAYQGFFMAKDSPSGPRLLVTAESAESVPPGESSEGAAAELKLRDGVLIRERRDAEGRMIASQLSFEAFPLAVGMDEAVEAHGPRGQDEREYTLPELAEGRVRGTAAEVAPARLRAEWHARVIEVLSLPALGMLAIPLGLAGGGRGGKARGLAVGVVVLVLYEKLLGLGHAAAELGRVSPWIGLWLPWAALVAAAAICLHCLCGDRVRRLPRADRSTATAASS